MVQYENYSAVANNKDENDDGKLEDRLRLVLESAMKPPENLGKISKESLSEFANRLSSFSPLTYFGKPSCLSPLVCARLGWRNAEKDLLVCSSCHAALAIAIHIGLSPDSKEKICQVYREKLATCHKPHCPFNIEGKEFLRNQKEEEIEQVIPSYFVDVFPSECVEVVETPRPISLLQSRAEQLEEQCPPEYKFPDLEVPEAVRKQVVAIDDSTPNASSLGSQLQTTESVAILTLLGWEPIAEETKIAEDGESPSTVTLGCRFCYSRMELMLEREPQQKEQPPQEDEEETTAKSPPVKRTKLSRDGAPLDAHRHYCPYVCGFPSHLMSPKKPMWKSIVDRVHQEAEEIANLPPTVRKMTEEDYDETVYRINDILNAAIAPVDPRTLDDATDDI